MGLPLVATSDAHYLTQDDAAAHDVLLCINTGKTRRRPEPDAARERCDQFYVRSPEEMYAAVPGHEDAVASAARRSPTACDIQLDFKKRHFPVFTPPDGEDARGVPPRTLRAGHDASATATNPSARPRATGSSTNSASSTGWGSPAYFLIVWDFVRFAREKGIPSTARGSACGAIVSYVLYLSHV